METIYVHGPLDEVGEFVKVHGMNDEPFIYQYIRTEGYRSPNLTQYIELADAAMWQVLHEPACLIASELATGIERLLVHEGYSAENDNLVMLRCYGEIYSISICGTSLYKGLDLRAYRPKAITVETGGVYVGLPTSMAFAEAKLLEEYVSNEGAGAYVAVDSHARVVSVNGATPFLVRQGRIAVSRRSWSVEAQIVLRALERAGRTVEVREILRDELATADEVWGVGYEGITSLTECDGRIYSDIIADATARRL